MRSGFGMTCWGGVLELGVNGKGGFFFWFKARQRRVLGVSKLAFTWEFFTKEEGKGGPFKLKGGRCSTRVRCHELGVLSPSNTLTTLLRFPPLSKDL